MGKTLKYVDEFDFGPQKVHVKGYCRGGSPKKYAGGGHVEKTEAKADMKQDKATAKAAVHKHEKAMHKGRPLTKMANGGQVAPAAGGGRAGPVRQPPIVPDRQAGPVRQPPVVPGGPTRGVPVAPMSPLLAMRGKR